MKQKVVSYVRVSTTRQGASGLGLDAQRAAVQTFCQANGCELIAEYQEVESGRKNERPVLRQALAHAKKAKATLLLAKIDRLARNVAFIANLMEAGADFRACDMPEANKFMLHIMAAVAEQEASAISQRTCVALKAARERGTLLGGANPACRNLTMEARRRGSAATAKAASLFYADVLPLAIGLHQKGNSLRAIANILNSEGRATRKGSPWSATQVQRLLTRVE
ncbi:MAG TPA: recombinase family protein [Candidatus Baltobacteraceae bacterium]|nr:recombinase family protein [Candidatus Baltobacteraceae bacterium]